MLPTNTNRIRDIIARGSSLIQVCNIEVIRYEVRGRARLDIVSAGYLARITGLRAESGLSSVHP